MAKTILFFFVFLICLDSFGQDSPAKKIAGEIVAEGKELYRSELASWYGTDIFLEKYMDRARIGGYFSYAEGNTERTIFFSKDLTPKVIGTISFNSAYSIKTAKVSLTERNFLKKEQDLFIIRTLALNAIKADTTFRIYEKTDLNLIPLISAGGKKVYILTGPKEDSVVIFGNDYLLKFDGPNQLISKRQLHRSILFTKTGSVDGKETTAAMHTHLPGMDEYITPSDICTLMLYEKFTKWEKYYVVSPEYFSIWDCKTNELKILTTEAAKQYLEQEDNKRKYMGILTK